MRVLLCILLCSNVLLGQIQNSVYPKSPYSNVNHLAVDGDNIIMSGTCETVTISHDDGNTWKHIELPNTIYALTIIPGTGGDAYFLTANEVYLYKATEESFEVVSKSSMQLEGGSFVNAHVHEGVTYLVTHGAVFKASPTYDWENIMTLNFTDGVTQHSDLTSTSIFVASNKGEIKKLDLLTNTITDLKNLGNRINNFDMVTDKVGYATVSGLAALQKTIDGGATYFDLPNMPENIRGTGYGENIIFTINTNRMYRSTDGGSTATYIPYLTDGTTDLIQDYHITEDGVLYLAGRSSTIIRSMDFGDTFESLNSQKKEWLSDIEVHPSGTGYAIGGEYTLLKTSNNGASWMPVDASILKEDNYLNDLVMLDANTVGIAAGEGFYVLENDVVKHSVDGNYASVAYNATEDYLIAVRYNGSAYEIAKSVDGGVSWIRKSFAPDATQNIFQSNTGKIYIAQYTGNLITSVDGGESWEIEEVPDLTSITEVAFWDDDFGLISSGSKLYKTLDGGKTVLQVHSAYSARNIEFITKDHFIVTGAQNSQTTIFESLDGGENVTNAMSFCSVTNSTFFDGENTVWLAQQGGHINKHVITGPSASRDIHLGSLLAYPNPVSLNGTLSIRVNGQQGEVSLYNTTGQQMKKVNTRINTEVIDISLDGLNAGWYSIEFRTETSIYTQRLIIVE